MTSQTNAVMVLCALVSSAVALKASSSSSLRQDLAVSLQERPVMKVVRMLEDMKAELTKEMKDDKAVMEEMDCWCTTNEKEKTEALALGSAKSKALSAKIDEYAGKISELKSKRAATLDELNKDIASLEQARELRMAESKEFQESETGLLDAIAAAQNAVVALSKHHEADFPQLRSAAHVLLKAQSSQLVSKALSKENVALLSSFLHGAEKATSFISIPGYQSYAPQSGQIFGILKQMKEDFQSSLSEEQKAEQKARAEFEALKKAKNAEIAQGKEMMVSVDASLADYGEKKATAEKELEDTDAQFALDTEFLKNLKEKCSATEAEFDSRMKDRLTEITAVEETIGILNSDESFDAFEKMAAAASFVQTSAASGRETQSEVARHRAVAVLQRAAAASGKPQLALIAATVQLDAFTKVIAHIDDLVKELEKQQAEEAEQKDVCNQDFFENKKATEAAYDKKESLLAKEADLTKTIEELTKDIAASTAANAELMKQMKRASETREAENADFQTTISDHRLMAIILQKALDRMKQVYLLLQQPGAPHIQTSATHTDPGNGPARFTKYEANAGGSRVVAMLENVLADVKKTEVDAIVAENDSQSAYEKFMKDSNKSVLQTLKALTNMKGALAKSKEELISTKEDLKQTVDKLEDLSKENGDLHAMCDYLLNNFDVRQKARAAEMEALGEAKAILSGSQ